MDPPLSKAKLVVIDVKQDLTSMVLDLIETVSKTAATLTADSFAADPDPEHLPDIVYAAVASTLLTVLAVPDSVPGKSKTLD